MVNKLMRGKGSLDEVNSEGRDKSLVAMKPNDWSVMERLKVAESYIGNYRP